MSRRPGPRIERTRATGGGEEDPTPGDTETSEAEEEEDVVDEISSSIGDLVGGADPNRFDQTFLVEKEDIPAAPTEPWPVPQPWQGLPRLAFVVNINYVYDDEEEQWVRQRPFDGAGDGAGGTAQQLTQQTIPGTNTNTVIDMDEVRYDSGNNVDLSNNQIEVPADGIYHVSGAVTYINPFDGGFLNMSVRLTSGFFILSISATPGARDSYTIHASKVLELSAGDRVELLTRQDSGTGLDTEGFGTSTYLSVSRIGPAP